MKYSHLKQIATFLNKNVIKIINIYRSNDLSLNITFMSKNSNNFSLVFDMSKSDSAIYLAQNENKKSYKAPFDILLKKHFLNAKILNVEIIENNRILCINALLQGSYKQTQTKLYFEFTGRFTNIIITNADDIILSALHLYKNSKRNIQISKKLPQIPPKEITESFVLPISDFMLFFKEEQTRIINKNLDMLRKNKIASIDKKISNLENLINNLSDKKSLENEANLSFAKATILKNNLYQIKEYERNFNLDGLKFSIEQSPKIALNTLFKNAKKLKAKANNIDKEYQNLNEKKEFLLELKTAIEQENNPKNIEILLPKKSTKHEKTDNDLYQNFYMNEYKISVGKNEKGNAYLLENAKKDDFWFHLQKLKGAHVIIKSNKQKLDDEIISFASKICVLFSGYKSGNFYVDFTQRRNVKIQHGAFVNYINYNTIGVKL